MSIQHAETHHEVVDITSASPRPRVLIVVANPTTSTTTGLPVGFWAAELFHPFHEFTNKRYDVTIASPEGGRVEVDALSDPRDESRWSADDLISMGALNTPEITGLLENTPALRDLDLDRFDAIVVAGGQAPMFQYRDHEDLKRAIAHFYESGKPTGVLCHGVSALIDVQLSNGSYLVEPRRGQDIPSQIRVPMPAEELLGLILTEKLVEGVSVPLRLPLPLAVRVLRECRVGCHASRASAKERREGVPKQAHLPHSGEELWRGSSRLPALGVAIR